MTTRQTGAMARMLTREAVGQASMVPSGIRPHARETDRPNLYKPIRVKPEEAQMVQWLVPGNEITYTILTNFDWVIE